MSNKNLEELSNQTQPKLMDILQILKKLRKGYWGAAFGFAFFSLVFSAVVSGWVGLYRFTGLGVWLDILLSGIIPIIFALVSGCLAILLLKALSIGVDRAYRLSSGFLQHVIKIPSLLFSLLPLPLAFFLGWMGGLTLVSSQWPNLSKLFFPDNSLLPVLFVEGALGAFTGFILAYKNTQGSRIGLFTLIFVFHLIPALWMVYGGTRSYLAQSPPVPPRAEILSLPDPSTRGSYSVETCSYGSGSDAHREAYSEDICWKTPTVNVRNAKWGFTGFADWYYEWFWDFNFDQLPMNGLVWAPIGKGPFPLVLIVHGNHAMGDFSEPGYGYLADLLASQGYIAVALDENFLNGSWVEDMANQEIGLRAWMVLKHLEGWREWNADPNHPFFNKVDMENISLIGHSRGGQAIAVAAAFNRQKKYPGGGIDEPFDFNFNIRSVVAIAPNDGDIEIGGTPVQLDGLNYLLLQGAHDADTFEITGANQYARTELNARSDLFKSIIYIYRANHGQFNSSWGRADKGQTMQWVLNTQPLLSAEEQQKITKVFVTSFLQATIQGKEEYRALFHSPWSGNPWLPEEIIVSEYQDGSFLNLTDFQKYTAEELLIPDGHASAQNMSVFEIVSLQLRESKGLRGDRALLLGWDRTDPAYVLHLSRGLPSSWVIHPEGAFSFQFGSASVDQDHVDVIVELTSANGAQARLQLSDLAPLQPPLLAQLTKDRQLAEILQITEIDQGAFDPVLQTYLLPLSEFLNNNRELDINALRTITFTFKSSGPAQVYLDDIGFYP